MTDSLKLADGCAALLLVLGGLNWGLVGLANIDLVAVLFGDRSALALISYTAFGLAAAYFALAFRGILRRVRE